MRPYELMVIVSGALDENAAHGWISQVTKTVGDDVHLRLLHGCELLNENLHDWQRLRRLGDRHLFCGNG